LFDRILELDVEGIDIVKELLPLQKCSFKFKEGINTKQNLKHIYPPSLIGELDSFLKYV
jgi:hypothetical protein